MHRPSRLRVRVCNYGVGVASNPYPKAQHTPASGEEYLSAVFAGSDAISLHYRIQQHGNVQIIANDQGDRITPSWVSFTPSERLIGQSAKNALHTNPRNTIFDAKRESALSAALSIPTEWYYIQVFWAVISMIPMSSGIKSIGPSRLSIAEGSQPSKSSTCMSSRNL